MKTVAFVFGRFNPPTIGHGKLLDALKATAQRNRADYYIFTSHSQDAKKNPLSHNQIFRYMALMFPSYKKKFRQKYGKSEIRNVFDIASAFHGEYEKLVMVVGSDRVSDFTSLLNTYNGIKAKHGFYEFKEIEIVSAGERDPDMEGATGMSASKMRAAAVKGDFDTFKDGIPSAMSDKDAKDMFNSVRTGLKLDVIREGMKRRRGLQEPVVVEKKVQIDAKELTWQGYDTINLSTCDEAFELFDEIVNSIGEGTFTTPEKAYLKEALILTDKCLTIAQIPKEKITETDEQNYMKQSEVATKLLETIEKRTGIPFEYSFLNDLQVKVVDNRVQPKKSFTQFSGEIYGIR